MFQQNVLCQLVVSSHVALPGGSQKRNSVLNDVLEFIHTATGTPTSRISSSK